MHKALVNYLSKYFVVQDYGVFRMNNATDQFKIIVDNLIKASSEIADQRAALEVEKNFLMDRIYYIDAQMAKASDDMSYALSAATQIKNLIY